MKFKKQSICMLLILTTISMFYPPELFAQHCGVASVSIPTSQRMSYKKLAIKLLGLLASVARPSDAYSLSDCTCDPQFPAVCVNGTVSGHPIGYDVEFLNSTNQGDITQFNYLVCDRGSMDSTCPNSRDLSHINFMLSDLNCVTEPSISATIDGASCSIGTSDPSCDSSSSTLIKCDGTSLKSGSCVPVQIQVEGETQSLGVGSILIQGKGATVCATQCGFGPSCDGCNTTSKPTTHQPATEAPTTNFPTTRAPTTGVPTTGVPTTGVPTTGVPTTGVPTTEAPTTGVPTTGVPTTGVPTTEAPTTEAPTTEAPTTEAPTTEAPTTEAPTTEAPTTEAPTTQSPSTGAPTLHPTHLPTCQNTCEPR